MAATLTDLLPPLSIRHGLPSTCLFSSNPPQFITVTTRRRRIRCSILKDSTISPSSKTTDAEGYTDLDCVVVGGGISGLCIAQALQTKHKDIAGKVIVTEARDRVGGNIITVERDGYLWEEGPNSFQPSDNMLTTVIHTKRRNKLSVEKMNSLAYVMYNRKLRERHNRKLGLKDDEELPVNLDECPSDNEWIAADDEGVPVNPASRSGLQIGEASQGTQGSESAHGTEDITYSRKRKRVPGGDSTRDKGKETMRRIEEESNLTESETEEEDEGDIQYDDDSGSDDDDDGIDGGDGSYDPNFQLPASDASMFQL